MKRKKKFCPYCGYLTVKKKEEDSLRDYCPICVSFFYENPLPVVSTILVSNRSVLLVKRGRSPYKGRWCLPTGFAEIGEPIEKAATRELEEESGIKGKIISLTDVYSSVSRFYGDIIFITFEAERIGGELKAGADATDARFFSLDKLPKLAFVANTKALQVFIKSKSEYWAIADSFASSIVNLERGIRKRNLLSDRLVVLIEKNATLIANLWITSVTTNRSTSEYHHFDQGKLYRRIHRLLSQFGKWLAGFDDDANIREFFLETGRERRKEGFRLSEVLSALGLIKKHIWEFALSQGMWEKILDIYTSLELDRRIVLFFDKAAFYTARGYEEAPEK